METGVAHNAKSEILNMCFREMMAYVKLQKNQHQIRASTQETKCSRQLKVTNKQPPLFW